MTEDSLPPFDLPAGRRKKVLALRNAVPRRMPLAWAEFAPLRNSLFEIGARVGERAAPIRIHFASASPDAAHFRLLAGRVAASGP